MSRKSLNGKLNWPCLSNDKNEAEADVEIKHWEERNSDIALSEIDQELESQRVQLHRANQWAGSKR